MDKWRGAYLDTYIHTLILWLSFSFVFDPEAERLLGPVPNAHFLNVEARV